MSSAEEIAALRKKRTFKKFTFRGIELDRLMDVSQEEFLGMINTRARRKMNRGIDRKGHALIEKLKLAKEACGPLDKPEPIKTHLRNMIIVPAMIGSVVAVYNGRVFNIVEIKGDMVGHYLGEFSITYKPVTHGRPGMGMGIGNKFIPN